MKSDTHEPTLSTDELTLSTGEPAPGELELNAGEPEPSTGELAPSDSAASDSPPSESALSTSEPTQGSLDYRISGPLIRVEHVRSWLLEQVPLVQCFFVAVSLHITFLPIVWIMGWALPWPKTPVFTTLIEYDLTNWPKVAKPKKISDYQDPDLND